MINYENLLAAIGPFGRYQKFICALMIFSCFPIGHWSMISVFVQDTPVHYCRIPEIDDFAERLNVTSDSEQYQRWLENSIPRERDGKNNLIRSKCKRYNDSGLSWNGTDVVLVTSYGNRTTIPCKNGWIFETFPGQVTIVTEWDAVCDKAHLPPLFLSLYVVGLLISSLIGGKLADKFGRRPLFLVTTALLFVSAILVSFSSSIYMYGIFLFASGLNVIINYLAAFVIVNELTNNAHRTLVAMFQMMGFSAGYLLSVPTAYLLPDWRWFTRFAGLAGLLFIPYYWLTPESPRWLITAGKYKEAKKLILKIARVNKKEVDEKDEMFQFENLLKDENNEMPENIEEEYTFLDLFRHHVIRKRSLIMFYTWFSTSMVYYCINLNTSNLGGNNYINCFIAAAVEFPAYGLSYFVLEKIGRRSYLAGCYIISGVACALAPVFLPVSQNLMIASAMISKFATTASFMVVYIYSCELFPTMMRSMSIGTASASARVGATIAPYLIFAGQQVSIYLPYISMGVAALVAAVLCLMLPETKKAPLPQNLDEALKLSRYDLKLCCKSSDYDDVKIQDEQA